MAHEQLKGRAQIDFIRVLSALVRKYGDDNVMVLTPQDLRGPRGGIKREVDPETGTLTYRFEFDEPPECKICGRCAPLVDGECPDCRH